MTFIGIMLTAILFVGFLCYVVLFHKLEEIKKVVEKINNKT